MAELSGNEHSSVFVHPQALCEANAVGEGTRIWAFAHVMRGAIVGRQCNIGEGVFVEAGAVLGDRVTVKNQCLLWDGVYLADDVFVGPGVVFTNDLRPRSPRMPEVAERYRSPECWLLQTHVERGVSLGARAVILPGIRLGQFAMIGAAAVVTRDVLPHQLVVGQPARPAGWVCVCGQKLQPASEPDMLTCPDCRTSFRLEGGRLVRQGSQGVALG
jgi:UDP-2-acetamido-3-amino-2,3-dideoxy-glucuronate N-acetyltransferase